MIKERNIRWYFDKYGSYSSLKQEKESIDFLGSNEVLIEIRYSGINSADVQLRQGKSILVRLYNGLMNPKKIRYLGQDFSGRVIAKGSKVSNFTLNDRAVL